MIIISPPRPNNPAVYKFMLARQGDVFGTIALVMQGPISGYTDTR